MKLVSIVMPTYNHQEYISFAIDSVIKQTYPDWELIVVNDGSTDNTGEISERYAKTEHRIKVIHQGNCGVSCARNNGIHVASGKYIKILDSDDWLDEMCLETQVNEMEDDIKHEVIYGDYGFANYNYNRRCIKLKQASRHDDIIVSLLRKVMYPTFSYLFKTSVFAETNFDVQLRRGEDYDFLLRTAAKGISFGYKKGITGYVRLHKGYRLSNTNDDETAFIDLHIFTKVTSMMEKSGMYNDERRNALANAFIESAMLLCSDPTHKDRCINQAMLIYQDYMPARVINKIIYSIVGIRNYIYVMSKLRRIRCLKKALL